MIICDTREQKNQHVIEYFKKHNITFIQKKLDTGDYMDSECMNITIDRKRNLHELMVNMCSAKDKSRFWKEIRRSKESGIKFYILCEHGGKYKNIKDVSEYQDKYSCVSGRELMERMYAAHIAYGVEFIFCSKRSTGKKILELLNYDC